ncbi:MAG TPA: c-type cytochrome [Gallionella sp.]|nr:c-type cytochrome [Gallionella sp.]
MPELTKKHDCDICHDIDKRLVGPAWKDVAKKYKGATKYVYKGKEYPLVEGLVMAVSKGTSGNWGDMPMPANDPDGTKQTDIQGLVRYMLNLAN